MKKSSKLEKLILIGEKILYVLDLEFVPSSLIRYVYNSNKDLKPKERETIVAQYLAAAGGELIRLTAYTALAIEKYF